MGVVETVTSISGDTEGRGIWEEEKVKGREARHTI